MKTRESGILLHITSLPSPYGIGDLGPSAYEFVDFLERAKQSFWQILPLNPTAADYDNSPYHGISAFANNPLLISPDLLIRDNFLSKEDLEPLPDFSDDRVDYPKVIAFKEKLFNRSYNRFCETRRDHEYMQFCRENSQWLDDFALFIALRAYFKGKNWRQWPREVVEREPHIPPHLEEELHERIEREKFLQYIFIKQWSALKECCNCRKIKIIGDIPIYVDYDSSDLWVNPKIFFLDEEEKPLAVSGVPPDYFSETGQLWGNPLYRWDTLKSSGYDWWIKRLERNLRLFDMVRIDHFRGFIAYWQIPTGETAVNGKWVKGPGDDFFCQLFRRFPSLPIIAEDLGAITPDVREIMRRFDFPGMRVILFSFGDIPKNPHLPHNIPRNCVVYTGTHDNNTVRGWFNDEATTKEKERLFRYLGRQVPPDELTWELIRAAFMSTANLAIIPIQDILGLGSEARMNRPATEGNWRWRLLPDQLSTSIAEKIGEFTEIYERG